MWCMTASVECLENWSCGLAQYPHWENFRRMTKPSSLATRTYCQPTVSMISEHTSILNVVCGLACQRKHRCVSVSCDICDKFVVSLDVTSQPVSLLQLILSWLDYCNAVLSGLPRTTTAPLQRFFNASVQLVFNLRPQDPVLPALIELPWLPIESRVQYKLCLLVHSARVGKAPVYITILL